jgi:hypothetical protein
MVIMFHSVTQKATGFATAKAPQQQYSPPKFFVLWLALQNPLLEQATRPIDKCITLAKKERASWLC